MQDRSAAHPSPQPAEGPEGDRPEPADIEAEQAWVAEAFDDEEPAPFEEDQDDAPASGPATQATIECPICGGALDPGAEECPNCHGSVQSFRFG